MNEENISSSNPSSTPEAIVKTKKGFSFSIVWLVPVVAALIGGWLVYKAFSEKGPTITITFKTAEGLEAGKTKIKYKDVDIGQVESIDISEDLSHVIVTAELGKRSEKHEVCLGKGKGCKGKIIPLQKSKQGIPDDSGRKKAGK